MLKFDKSNAEHAKATKHNFKISMFSSSCQVTVNLSPLANQSHETNPIHQSNLIIAVDGVVIVQTMNDLATFSILTRVELPLSISAACDCVDVLFIVRCGHPHFYQGRL